MKIIFLVFFLMFYKIYCLDKIQCITPESKSGYCVTILNCQKLIPILIDIQKYKENLCIINNYRYNETEINDIIIKLPWLTGSLKSDGALDFLKGHYTLNQAGICCPEN